MALKLSTDLKNYIVNKGIIQQMAGFAGTAGTAVLNIYSGSQPASADGTASGVLLCTISGIGWGLHGSAGSIGTTSGTAALASTAGYVGTAVTSGTAGWARLETFGTNFTGSAGTFRIDGDIGTSGVATFIIDSNIVTGGVPVTLLTAPVYMA